MSLMVCLSVSAVEYSKRRVQYRDKYSEKETVIGKVLVPTEKLLWLEWLKEVMN